MEEFSAEAESEQVESDIPVQRLIGVGLLTRLLIDTAVQMFFPSCP